ncbi:MAG TPA: hypothetical protein VGJ18_25975 [Gemmatimonadaceae bacterium]
MRSRYLLPLVAFALACTHTEALEPCPALACALPLALEITLTGSPAGTPLTTASYRVLPSGSPMPCSQGAAANTCVVFGSPGTYQIEISATNYTTVQRTIVVAAKPAVRCACQSDDTQFLTIAMSPAS